MKKYLPKISAFLLTLVLIFAVSGFLFPQTAQAGVYDVVDCVLSPIDCAFKNFVTFLVGMMLKFAALLTGLAGIILNGVVYLTVVKVAENYSNIPAISQAWGVIRDVANMGFIFILLYAAIQTILGIGSDTKKLIVNVIVVAILINFSLFFTKIVIDASNVLAITFYDAIAPGALNAAGGLNLTQAGLSNAFMQHLSLTSLYKIAEGGQVSIAGIITIGIMGSVMLLIAAFVFFAVAILFIIRYVILILVLILSPIAFVAFVLPQLKTHGDKWKDALIGQAFFAPIYFMLTWVTLYVLGGVMSSFGVATGTTAPDTAQALGSGIQTDADGNVIPNAGTFTMFINFIVVIVFLIASLIIAKTWANKAGPGATGLTKWAMGAAGGASFGLASRLGRGTAGRLGAYVGDNEGLKERAAKGGMGGMAARLALATGRKTAGANFDVRGTGLGNTLQAGKAQEGGFTADLKKKVEAEKKYADETFKPSELQVIQAEKALGEAKKTGTTDDIKAAQAELDRISGTSEDVLRQRKIKEFRARGDTKKQAKAKLDDLEDKRLQEINILTTSGMTQEEAEKDAESRKIGWSPKAEKGLLNARKESYAGTVENPRVGRIPFSLTGRHVVFGPVKKEGKLAANAIRKSMKEKKAGEKIAEEIENQARESGDEAETTPTTPPSPTPPTPPTP